MTADAPRQDRTSTEKTSYVRRFATTRTIMALLLREMTTRYGRSPGGYVWALLEPIGAIMIFAVGFSLLFKNPPLGSSFILFFATGFLPFNLYQNISVMVARALVFFAPPVVLPSRNMGGCDSRPFYAERPDRHSCHLYFVFWDYSGDRNANGFEYDTDRTICGPSSPVGFRRRCTKLRSHGFDTGLGFALVGGNATLVSCVWGAVYF